MRAYSKGIPVPFLIFLFWPQDVWLGLPSDLLQEIHILEKVLGGVAGWWDSRMSAGKSFFWVTALHGSWHSNASGNCCSDRHHLSHLNIPERVASVLKIVSFLSSCSERARQPLSNGGEGKKRKEERKEKKMVRRRSKWVIYKVNTDSMSRTRTHMSWTPDI